MYLTVCPLRAMIPQWENECISLSVLSTARVITGKWENECISLSVLSVSWHLSRGMNVPHRLSSPCYDISVGEWMYLTVYCQSWHLSRGMNVPHRLSSPCYDISVGEWMYLTVYCQSWHLSTGMNVPHRLSSPCYGISVGEWMYLKICDSLQRPRAAREAAITNSQCEFSCNVIRDFSTILHKFAIARPQCAQTSLLLKDGGFNLEACKKKEITHCRIVWQIETWDAHLGASSGTSKQVSLVQTTADCMVLDALSQAESIFWRYCPIPLQQKEDDSALGFSQRWDKGVVTDKEYDYFRAWTIFSSWVKEADWAIQLSPVATEFWVSGISQVTRFSACLVGKH